MPGFRVPLLGENETGLPCLAGVGAAKVFNKQMSQAIIGDVSFDPFWGQPTLVWDWWAHQRCVLVSAGVESTGGE